MHLLNIHVATSPLGFISLMHSYHHDVKLRMHPSKKFPQTIQKNLSLGIIWCTLKKNILNRLLTSPTIKTFLGPTPLCMPVPPLSLCYQLVITGIHFMPFGTFLCHFPWAFSFLLGEQTFPLFWEMNSSIEECVISSIIVHCIIRIWIIYWHTYWHFLVQYQLSTM